MEAEEAGLWSVRFNNVLELNPTTLAPNPEYSATFMTDVVDFDVWGRDFDASDHVLTVPGHLVVLGSRPAQAHTQQEAEYISNAPKLRATLKGIDGVNLVPQVHRIDNDQTNFELYGDYDLGEFLIGGIVRHVHMDDESDDNSTTAVGFATTEVSGIALGASFGSRFGDDVGDEAVAFGVTAATDVSEQLNVQGSFVYRGADFLEDRFTIDQAFQRSRFRNNSSTVAEASGKGTIIEVIATYQDEDDYSVTEFIDVLEVPKMTSYGVQGIVRIQVDGSDNPQQQFIVRGGSPLANKLWGAAQVTLRMDEDGAGTAAGTQSESMFSILVASVVYELTNNWDARLGMVFNTAHATPENGTASMTIASIGYEMDDVTATFGYRHYTSSSEDESARQLFAEFGVEF